MTDLAQMCAVLDLCGVDYRVVRRSPRSEPWLWVERTAANRGYITVRFKRGASGALKEPAHWDQWADVELRP